MLFVPGLIVNGVLSLVDQDGGQVGGEYLGVEVLIDDLNAEAGEIFDLKP